jgi:type I restriction enzyme, S subunit
MPRPRTAHTSPTIETSGAAAPAATPVLRFPQFRTEGWHETPLNRLAVIIDDRVGTADCIPYTVTSGVGLLSQQDKFGRSIAGNSFKNYVRLKRDDFAYNKSATKAYPEGYIARYSGSDNAAVPNSIFTCFRPVPGEINPAYLEYLFAANLHGRWLRKFLTIGARAHGSLNVSDDDLMALPVPLPSGRASLDEQQKVADCLTSLDDCVAAQGRKVRALKDHKKGLMQHLFPQEGQTRPRIRFPAFRDGPEWETQPLGETAEFQSGGTPSKSNPAFWNGTTPWVSAKDMKSLFLEDTEDHISKAAIDDGAKVVPTGTVLILTRGMTLLKDVPICLPRRPMSFNQDVRALRPRDDSDGCFLAFLLVAHRERLMRLVDMAGHGTGRLDTDKLKALEIALPHPAEKQRIADCLGSLDAAIAAESAALATLKAHKRGLMQGLFPLPGGA